MNEGSEAKTKWGYVARAPGAEIQIRVDTTAPVGEKQAAPGGGGGGGGDAAGGGEKSTGGDGGGEGSDGDGGGGAEEGGGGEAEEGGGGAEEEEGEGSGDKEAAAAGVDRGGGEQGQEVAVFVAHLKSYEHMGKAQVRCARPAARARPAPPCLRAPARASSWAPSCQLCLVPLSLCWASTAACRARAC